MKKQRNQVIALVLLLVFWAVLWRVVVKKSPAPPPAAKEAPAKQTQAESLLKGRFRRVRSEMDALYHYRIKPVPFNAHWNPFRIPGVVDAPPAGASASKSEGVQLGIPPPDISETLLKGAIAAVRVGGVVTRNGTVQLTVDGQLHKEGDVFTVKVQTSKNLVQSVAVRIKQLSEAAVTFALEDPESGNAEVRVRLK
ncbi:MAG TPA: hypothetical protein VKG78_01955 [Opitutaceae bacterium]|nr:hypothetical protein [Opitutaceae bacterium]